MDNGMGRACRSAVVLAAVAVWCSAACSMPPGESNDNSTDNMTGDDNANVSKEVDLDTEEGLPVSFSSGGATLDARSLGSAESSSTTVRKNDQLVLRLEASVDGLLLTFPETGDVPRQITFFEPLAELPGEFAVRRLAVVIAGQILSRSASGAADPGCAFISETRCAQRCCVDHETCYDENHCSFTAWMPNAGSDACGNCNGILAECVLRGCGSAQEDNAESDMCFDPACRQSYTCEDHPLDCLSCDRPCRPPETCGNGSCEFVETTANCAADCASGLGMNICCIENGGCPSETPDMCAAQCCCCDRGTVCGAANLCAFPN